MNRFKLTINLILICDNLASEYKSVYIALCECSVSAINNSHVKKSK